MLIAPAVGYNRLALELAHIEIAVVAVNGVCDVMKLLGGKSLGVYNLLVVGIGPEYGVGKPCLKIHKVTGADDIGKPPLEGRALKVDYVIIAVEIADAGAGRIALPCVAMLFGV